MNSLVPVYETPDFDLVVEAALKTVADSSARVYSVAYAKYGQWCEDNHQPLLPLTPNNIEAFLTSMPTTKTTRQNYMSALRKLAWVLALDFNNPQNKAIYEYMLKMRVPEDNLGGRERNRIALSPAQAEKVLHYWLSQPDNPRKVANYARNHALLCCALATGMRRSEVAALEWRDTDLGEGVIHVRHGKGDESRDVAVVGNFGVNALLKWKAIQGNEWKYVFVTVNKGGKLGTDEPIEADTYYRMVKEVSRNLGFDFSTHDFRRTLITELLRMGSPQADVQAQAGHAHPSTTQRYAQPANASERKRNFRVRW